MHQHLQYDSPYSLIGRTFKDAFVLIHQALSYIVGFNRSALDNIHNLFSSHITRVLLEIDDHLENLFGLMGDIGLNHFEILHAVVAHLIAFLFIEFLSKELKL